MLTYQDFMEVNANDTDIMAFIRRAIQHHKDTKLYRIATIAEAYYRKCNTTIMEYEKTLVTASGKIVRDQWSPNHKVVSGFFSRFVRQQNQYLLSNGATWGNEATDKKLGKKFDTQLQKLGKAALIGGVAFGFWNLDHMQVFKVTEFAPLFDEENGALRAGVRWWQIDSTKPLRATLYEEDGYTDYMWNTRDNRTNGMLLHPKRAYKIVKSKTIADGEEIRDAQNYPGFPIIPLWANEEHQSELVGIREGIDAYDLIKNGFENDLDSAQLYWIIKGAGGMDQLDLVQFLDRLYVNKIASIEGDQEIEAQTVSIPYDAREQLLNRIERDLYRDYQALNVDDIKTGSVVVAQIKAAYESMNAKANEYEFMIHEFLDNLLEIVGIEDDATFNRSMLVNQTEVIDSVLSAADHLSKEYVTRKILTLLDDVDAYDDVIKQMDSDDMDRLNGIEESQGKEENQEEEQTPEEGE